MMRHFSLLPFALAAIGFAHAQTIHNVVVGDANGTPIYTPNQVTAMVGDIVKFQFQRKNHTVTQSSFASPCTPLEGGFDSGFMPVGVNDTDFPTVQLTVKDDQPIWGYCRQTGHCQAGMVFGINPAGKFDAFLAAAKASGSSNSSSTSAPPSTATPPTSSPTSPPTSSPPTSPPTSPPPSTSPTTHVIEVGANGTLTYSPSNITAQPGDTLMFKFLAKNHTVTQSAFAVPCRKIGDTTSTPGFDSGFMPVAANSTDFPTFQVTVNDTKPTWVYCRQTNPVSHCGMGMVFAVNANESSPNSFEAFVALAKQQNGTASSNGTSGGNSGGNSTGSSGNTKSAASSVHTMSAFVINASMLVLGLVFFSGLN